MWKDNLQKQNREDFEEKRLPRSFFTRDGITVAGDLLGKVLVHKTSVGVIRGVITEVESYMGVNDKGSHTYGGRRTKRTKPMFHIGGTSYVYFTYGMYHCMNIATGEAEDPQAVLIRSVVPLDEESKEKMLQLRMAMAEEKALHRKAAQIQKEPLQLQKNIEKHLADGPGKLCIAMEISKADNDIDMVESKEFYVIEGISVDEAEICEGKRIGIDYAEEAADYLWRFYLREL